MGSAREECAGGGAAVECAAALVAPVAPVAPPSEPTAAFAASNMAPGAAPPTGSAHDVLCVDGDATALRAQSTDSVLSCGASAAAAGGEEAMAGARAALRDDAKVDLRRQNLAELPRALLTPLRAARLRELNVNENRIPL